MKSNFNKRSFIEIKGDHACFRGWSQIGQTLKTSLSEIEGGKAILVVECYHGVFEDEVISGLSDHVNPALLIKAREAYKRAVQVARMVFPDVTDDRIFGRITDLTLDQYLDPGALRAVRSRIDGFTDGLIIVVGIGASLVAGHWDLLVYADMARWEIQKRMRRHEVDNLGVENRDIDWMQLYKQGYFVDWRVCDRLKQQLMGEMDFVLDTNLRTKPKMIAGNTLLAGLEEALTRPFSVVPFFDPGPWGGHWMQKVCDLDPEQINFAWCFNCVPEENSLLFKINDILVEIPSINLVFHHPEKLLGEPVYQRFGAEFPIRFDFLDTMDGGNLSLQVHPLNAYIKEHFGMAYTQDESYYMMDAAEGAVVYLGLKEGIDPLKMFAELREAQNGSSGFDADKFVAAWPVKKHDHVHIPAGTIHCSGKNSMVLEISATPYIFTFKLWDWGRVGLDGKPRPINIDRGAEVIQWDRTASWVENNLIHQVERVAEGEGWYEERTGLHESGFIETRRHWFSKKVTHSTGESVNVINLVEGREALVECPSGSFEPFKVHYAETFIVPASVNQYTIIPCGESEGKEIATLKAFVRT